MRGSARPWRSAEPGASNRPPSKCTIDSVVPLSAGTPGPRAAHLRACVPVLPPTMASPAVSPIAPRPVEVEQGWPKRSGSVSAAGHGTGNQPAGVPDPRRGAGGCVAAQSGRGPAMTPRSCPAARGEPAWRVGRHPLGCVRFGPVAARCKPRFPCGDQIRLYSPFSPSKRLA